jgi:hypothetical protein
MAKLKVTLTDGAIHEIQVTPRLEWAFETYAKKGFKAAFITEDTRQTDLYWLAWEGLRINGHSPKPFGEGFLDQLKEVEVLGDDPLE